MQVIISEIIEGINPLVSVDIITYNHEKYAAEAIEGVLMQKTNFKYEIVICDDYSTDNTREILLDYQKKYPDKIILRFQEKNVGLRYNYFENKKACRGKYIAICEGDDYWTDPNKLQMEVDFLEENQGYSMVFTNALQIFEFENINQEPVPFNNLENRDYSGKELLINWLIPTPTVVYRNNISYDFNQINKYLFYDTPLFLRIHDFGKIRCFNKTTAVYRRHENSITYKPLTVKQIYQYFKGIQLEFPKIYDKEIAYLNAKEYFFESKREFKKKSLKSINLLILSFFFQPKFLLIKISKKIKRKGYNRH
jgi:glycosyltransferase involved in cell wall biosynthesis